MTPEAILRTLVHPDATDADRWLMRVALLETCGIEVTPEKIALIGGCSVELALGAVGGLASAGFVKGAPA